MPPKQLVPDIDFKYFVLAEIPKLFQQNKTKINKDYQRGDIWKLSQKIELIKSISNRYSIGVLVLFINDNNQYEILDGQQRLLTIKQYLEDKIDLSKSEIQKYSELEFDEKTLLDAYCVFYLKLKSHDPESKEEDIVQTFLRLQEGTPLNKAEKLNAFRGLFKDTFRDIRESHPLFAFLGNDKRFRLRQLSAELLALELESDFENRVFPSLDLGNMTAIIKKYEKSISKKKVSFYKGNLDFLHQSLNLMLTALQPRELTTFYLLISFLRKKKADNYDLFNEFSEFAKEFLKNLNTFSVYDIDPPDGMDKDIFDSYKKYKLEAKIMTTSSSIKNRFEIVLNEYKRLKPFIEKDIDRLHDTEQKRILYFKQKGLCPECSKAIHFKNSSSHHVIAHSKGGDTNDLNHAVLLHVKCHQKLEKRLRKSEDSLFDKS